MAWNVGSLASGNSASASQNTLTIVAGSGSQSLGAGSVLILAVATDNTTSGDNQTSLVTSITDNDGNTWSKVAEYTNGQTAANAGATVSVWKVDSTVSDITLSNQDTITVNFGSAVSAKAASVLGFKVGSGNAISITAFATNSTDGASAGTIVVSGLASSEYLYIHAIAAEGPSSDSIALASGYTAFEGVAGAYDRGTNGGGSASNMSLKASYRINTSTSETVKANTAAADIAQLLIAIHEEAPAGAILGTDTITFGHAAVLTGSGALVASNGMTFSDTGVLLGSMPAAGVAAVTFTDSATLMATLPLTGAAAMTFTEAATLDGAGALVGAAPVAFMDTGTLVGDGALVGADAVTFGHLATLGGAAPIAGTSAVSFTDTATLLATAPTSGVAAMTFAEAGVLTGSGALVGTAAVTFSDTAVITGSMPAAGTSAVTFSDTAVLLGNAPIAGTAAVTFGHAANLTELGGGVLSGANAITFTDSATLTGTGSLSGVASLTFTDDSLLGAEVPIAGSAAMTFTNIGSATDGIPPPATTTPIVVTPSGVHRRPFRVRRSDFSSEEAYQLALKAALANAQFAVRSDDGEPVVQQKKKRRSRTLKAPVDESLAPIVEQERRQAERMAIQQMEQDDEEEMRLVSQFITIIEDNWA